MTTQNPSADRVPFVDLHAQRQRIDGRVGAAIGRVLEHCRFILGPEVGQLEHELGQFCGAREVVTCANGTDALGLILRAKGVCAGQAILCPSFTFAATAEVVAWFGASPVFVDVDPDTFNVDVRSLEAGIATAHRSGLKPVGVIVVDLFGQPADYSALEPLCAAHGLWLLADAAQSFGATYRGRRVGTIGVATATSFFPSKPLGCYGDGGAIFTDDADLAATLRSLRMHGEGTDKYDNVRIGVNGRLDTIQAAILLEKLKIFPDELDARNAVAARYSAALGDRVQVPTVLDECTSVWAQYTIRLDAGQRDAVASALSAAGISTAVYYRKPLHRQPAYCNYPVAANGLPVSEALAAQVLSLPMHAYLQPDVQERIIEAMHRALD